MELLARMIEDYTVKRKRLGACYIGKRLLVHDFVIDIVNQSIPENHRYDFWCKANRFASIFIPYSNDKMAESNCLLAFVMKEMDKTFPMSQILKNKKPWGNTDVKVKEGFIISLPTFIIIAYNESGQENLEPLEKLVQKVNRDAGRFVINVTKKKLERYLLERIIFILLREFNEAQKGTV